MTDSLLVGAVRDREPAAVEAVFDAHAASLYRYGWFLLGDAEAARVALRDTFVIMDRRIGDLADPSALRAWLYAIVRAECLWRGRGEPDRWAASPDEDPGTVELRAVAVGAIAGLDETLRDVLELTTRHALRREEIASVLDLSPEKVDDARVRGTQRLRRTLTAELLARKGAADCDQRDRMLRTAGSRMTEGLRDRLVEHAAACPACQAHRPRNATPAKVFGLLPDVAVPDSLRVRVMSGLTDPLFQGYRNFVVYRAGIFDTDGFPRARRAQGRSRPRVTRRARIGIGLLALLCLAVSAGYLVSAAGGADSATRTIRSWAGQSGPGRGAQPTVRPGRSPGRDGPGVGAPPGRTPWSVPGGTRRITGRATDTATRTAKTGRLPGGRAAPSGGRYISSSDETSDWSGYRPGGSPWSGRPATERSVPLGTRLPARMPDGAHTPVSPPAPIPPAVTSPPATRPSPPPSRIPQRHPNPRHHHHHHHKHPPQHHPSHPHHPSHTTPRGTSPSSAG